MKRILFLLLMAWPAAVLRADTITDITQRVSNGHWQEAKQEIAAQLAQTNLDFQTREALLFQSDRMHRIRLDLTQTRDQVFQDVQAIVPSITEKQFANWEKAGAVESLNVDGTNWYFKFAANNLFRVNAEAKALKDKADPGGDGPALYRLADIQKPIAHYAQTGDPRGAARTWRFSYELSVQPGIVPPGEIVRAWLPFPHAGNRQKNIRLISTSPARHLISDTDDALSSVYLEQPAATNGPTRFKITFEFTSDAFYEPIDAARVQPTPANDPSLAHFLGEEPPHIVFSDEITNLSREIVGDETNPYLKARRIFKWVYEQIPWASAREYSTLDCLSAYALGCHHGDCGIKTMTFMTLCRFNGIPARWETGWTMKEETDLHDWCEIYLAPYGWVPADVTYGLVNSTNEQEKWFYLGGIDAGRLVVNTDYDQPLYPAKTHFRSEIVDFQRGEVEWRGGNLYFDQWDYSYDLKELTPVVRD